MFITQFTTGIDFETEPDEPTDISNCETLLGYVRYA